MIMDCRLVKTKFTVKLFFFTLFIMAISLAKADQGFSLIIDNEDTRPPNYFQVAGGFEHGQHQDALFSGAYYHIGHPFSTHIDTFEEALTEPGVGVAQWHFEVPDRSKMYVVSARWSARSFHARSAQYTIYHQNGIDTVVVDQTQNNHQFVELGTYLGPYLLELSNETRLPEQQTEVSGFVFADSIKISDLPLQVDNSNDVSFTIAPANLEEGAGSLVPRAVFPLGLQVQGDFFLTPQPDSFICDANARGSFYYSDLQNIILICDGIQFNEFRGPDGQNGVGISTLNINEQGNLMATLDDGRVLDVGNTVGPKGDPGESGEQGNPGVSINSVNINAEGRLIISLDDGSTLDAGNTVGPQGEPGVGMPQTLTKQGNTITLSEGGGTITDEVDDSDADPTNEVQSILRVGDDISLTDVSGNGGGTVSVADSDADPINEIQSLDQAYDVGRVIVADQGPVNIAGRSGLLVNGNVGLGTEVAGAKLDIAGGIVPQLNNGQLRIRSVSSSSRWDIFHNASAFRDLGLVFNHDGEDILILNNNEKTYFLNTSVGIGTTNPAFTLEVNGSAGKLGGGSWSATSDRRLKKDIKALSSEESLNKLMQLNPVSFSWIHPKEHGNVDREIGFIAQEVAAVFPDWVDTARPQGADKNLVPNGESIKAIHFPHAFNAYLVQALKQQQAQISALKAIVCADHPNEGLCQP